MFARGSLDGEGVALAGEGRIPDERLPFLRALLMYKLCRCGLSRRQTAVVLGCSKATVVGQINAIPEGVKRLHAKTPLV